MTIINQAAHTIMETENRIQGHLDGITFLRALAYAKALQDAGLLAPEPPEIIGTNSDFNSPIFDGGYCDVEARNQKEIRVSVDYSTELCLNAYQARCLAAALLVAANHAEKEQKP